MKGFFPFLVLPIILLSVAFIFSWDTLSGRRAESRIVLSCPYGMELEVRVFGNNVCVTLPDKRGGP